MISTIVIILQLVLLYSLNSIGVIERPAALITVCIAIFTIAYIADIQRNESLKPVRNALLMGFFFRLAILFFDVYGRSIYVLPNSGSDAEMFYYESYIVAMGGTSIRGLFVTVTGTLMHFIGVSRLYTQFLLMLCSMMALHIGDKTLRECNVNDESRRSTMLILSLLPNFAILSSIFLRESIVTMFITIAIYLYVCWLMRGGLRWIVLAVSFVLIAMSFHSGAVAVLIAFIPGLVLYDREKKSLSLSLANIIPTFILIALGVYFLNRYGDVFLGKFSKVNSLEDIANVRDVARSSYARYVGNSDSILNMIIYSVPRVFFFLFSPLPFQWRGISDIIAFLFSSLFYIVVLYRAIRCLRSTDETKKPMVLILLIIAMSAAFVFAWGTTNSGTAVRHRDKMIILYGVIYGIISSNSDLNGNETNAWELK